MKQRRTDGRKRRRGKTVLMIAAAVAVILFALGMLAGNYLYNFSLNAARTTEFRLDGKPRGEDESVSAPVNGEQIGMEGLFSDPEWLASVGAADEWITSHDGLDLHALTIRTAADAPWMVLLHGYTSSCRSMASFAKGFFERGWNILMPDLRGHGESEGTYRGMGWDDRADILRWLELLVSRDPDCEIAMYGISMGGAAVMMVSGEPLPNNVKALIEDCGYSSVYDEFSYQLGNIFHLPAFPFMQFADLVTRLRAGSRLIFDGSSIEQLKKNKTPMLFIHGTEDTFVPFSMLAQVYDAAVCEKEQLIVEGAVHGMSFATDPERFWGAIDAFLAKHTV